MFDTSDPFFITRLFGIVLLVALVWEMLWPRRAEMPDLRFRWLNNLALTAIGQLFTRGVGVVSAIAVAFAVERNVDGLLSDPALPWPLVFVLTVLVFDGVGYALHIAYHKVPWLWRFHAIHHSDTSLDITSTYRHHPGEIILTAIVSLPLLVLLAPPASAMVVYQALRMAVNVLQHSNIRIPEPVERILCRLVVTPDFHRLHHCSERRHTDSNYASVLPLFDYLFRTASSRPYAEQETMQLGLEYCRERRDSRLDRLLLLPFTWHGANDQPAFAEHVSVPVAGDATRVRDTG